MHLSKFRRLPLLGILRGIEAEHVAPLAEAIAVTDLEAIEITMNTPDAPALIRHMVSASNNRFAVGAGTVPSLGDLDAALGAGATFIVMPVLIPEVAAACVAKDIPVFPGALTPQEIFAAWRAGATMVKVFPASCFGPVYFKEVQGPFRDIELLACGGVTAENMPAYFGSGASAVAFGGSVFRSEWLAAGEFGRIQAEIRALVDACRRAQALGA
jgi:2-dehydro-3-deoxyphosphogluconate aldolase/(4S)-4-hydroxy-2-oxoglutarate aldolase